MNLEIGRIGTRTHRESPQCSRMTTVITKISGTCWRSEGRRCCSRSTIQFGTTRRAYVPRQIIQRPASKDTLIVINNFVHADASG